MQKIELNFIRRGTETDFKSNFKLGKKQLKSKNYNSAKEFFEKCLTTEEIKSDFKQKLSTLFYLHRADFENGKFKEGIVYLNVGLNHIDSPKNDPLGNIKISLLRIKFLLRLLVSYLILSDINESNKNFNKLANLINFEENVEKKVLYLREFLKCLFKLNIWKASVKKPTFETYDFTTKDVRLTPLLTIQSKLHRLLNDLFKIPTLINFLKYLNEKTSDLSDNLIKLSTDDEVLDNIINKKSLEKIKIMFRTSGDDSLEFYNNICKKGDFLKDFFKKIPSFSVFSTHSYKSPLANNLINSLNSPEHDLLKAINAQFDDLGNNSKIQAKIKTMQSAKKLNILSPIMSKNENVEDPTQSKNKDKIFVRSPKKKNTVVTKVPQKFSKLIINEKDEIENANGKIFSVRELESSKKTIHKALNDQESVKLIKLPLSKTFKENMINQALSEYKKYFETLKENYKSGNFETTFDLNIPCYITRIITKSNPGKRYNTEKVNQDIFFSFENFLQIKNVFYFGVCDGHGEYGEYASNHVKLNLAANIQLMEVNRLVKEREKAGLRSRKNKIIDESEFNTISEVFEKEHRNLSIIKKDLKEFAVSIKDGFLKTHEDILSKSFDTDNSGTTACSVIVYGNNVICANVGDSRAIVGKLDQDKWKSLWLSKDQKPERFDESLRILSHNGRVEAYKDENDNDIGPKRVWLKDEDGPGLAMSRSIGDQIARKAGVICEPEIFEYKLEKCDKFIIIASDGVWEFISNEKAVEIVSKCAISKNYESGVIELLKAAREEWEKNEEIIDDITAVVIYFDM